MAQTENQVHLEKTDRMDQPPLLRHNTSFASTAPMDLLDLPERLGLRDHQETPELQAQTPMEAIEVHQVHLDHLDHLDLMDNLETPVHQDCRVSSTKYPVQMDHQDHLGHPEHQDQMESQELMEIQERTDLQDHQVTTDHQEHQDSQEDQVQMDQAETVDRAEAATTAHRHELLLVIRSTIFELSVSVPSVVMYNFFNIERAVHRVAYGAQCSTKIFSHRFYLK